MKDKITQVNNILEKGEPDNIQEDKRGGRTVYGYYPQNVIDAVNEGLGTENWMYELLEHGAEAQGNTFNGQVILQLSLKVGGDWVTHGAIAGAQSNPVKYDAIKGAITDALKKALSHFGVGAKAYHRGGLTKVPGAVKDDIKAIKKAPSNPNWTMSDDQRKRMHAQLNQLNGRWVDYDVFKSEIIGKKYGLTSSKELNEKQYNEITDTLSKLIEKEKDAL